MNFASYTSSEYFPIFLTFYDSIKKNKNLNLYVLCLDDDVKSLIKKNNIECKTISIEDIELFTKSLLKKRYSKISEKIGVYRLAYANYLLKKLNIEDIHLIDSDTYFFSKTSDLEKVVNDLDASVCEIVETRYGIIMEVVEKESSRMPGFLQELKLYVDVLSPMASPKAQNYYQKKLQKTNT